MTIMLGFRFCTQERIIMPHYLFREFSGEASKLEKFNQGGYIDRG